MTVGILEAVGPSEYSRRMDAPTPRLASEFIQKDGELVRRLTIDGRSVETSVPVSRHTKKPLEDWWRAYLAGARPERVEGDAPVLRTVELFCGPGGLGLGFEQAAAELGHQVEVAAAVDQDAGAVGVYASNRPVGLTSSRSVTTLVDYHVRGTREDARFHYPPEMVEDDWGELAGTIDAVLAGPPCQGHSNLNNRTRRTDVRNELYLTVPAVALALGAPLVVIENVPAVVHDELGVVEATISLLREAGYQVQTGVLNASRLGWPQNRSRFFLVARHGDSAPLRLSDVADALAAKALPLRWALKGIPKRGRPKFMFETPEMSAENVERIDYLFDTMDADGKPIYDLPNSQRPDCHKDGTTYNSVYGRLRPGEPAPTITTGFFTPGRGRYIHPTERRVLNAAEAARLQGFPDNYSFEEPDGSAPARGQLAKWIGDAVPMPLGFAAGLSVLGPELTTD